MKLVRGFYRHLGVAGTDPADLDVLCPSLDRDWLPRTTSASATLAKPSANRQLRCRRLHLLLKDGVRDALSRQQSNNTMGGVRTVPERSGGTPVGASVVRGLSMPTAGYIVASHRARFPRGRRTV